MPEPVRVAEVQSLVLCRYANLAEAWFACLRITDAARARAWLARVVPVVNFGNGEPEDRAVNLAVTRSGIEALELGEATPSGFAAPFQEGMAEPRRAQRLGDRGRSAPELWSWGGTSTARAPHLLLLVYGRDAGAVADRRAACAVVPAHGLEIVWQARTRPKVGPHREREHFGFEDGLSQPWFEGMATPGPPCDRVAPGEMLLGYADQDGRCAPGPSVADTPQARNAGLESSAGRRDFGRDGTYLVLRQMQQDVHPFWRWLAGADPVTDALALERRGAKVVGRWPSGTPIVLAPDSDTRLPADNAFGYLALDADGRRCPLGAHARRANPRDAFPSTRVNGGDPVAWRAGPIATRDLAQASLRQVNRHRILRRGRSYGEPVRGWPEPAQMLAAGPDHVERGLFFICVNRDIERQFEFVQERWLNDPHFVQSGVDEVDAMVGDQQEQGPFTVPTAGYPVRFGGDDEDRPPRVVTVRGGEYFFLPGLRALRYLAG